MFKCRSFGEFVSVAGLVSDAFLKNLVAKKSKGSSISGEFLAFKIKDYQGYACIHATGLSASISQEIAQMTDLNVVSLVKSENGDGFKIINGMVSDGSAYGYMFSEKSVDCFCEISSLSVAS